MGLAGTSISPGRRRGLVLGLSIGLLLVLFPVDPVVAKDTAPATRYEVLGDVAERLDAVPEPSGAAASAVGDDGGRSGELRRTDAIEAPFPFTGFGVTGTGESSHLRVRTRDVGGDWSSWVAVELGHADHEHAPDQGTPEAARADRRRDPDGWSSDAIWAGPSTHVQLEVAGDPDGIEVAFLDTAGLSETALERAGRWLGSLGTAEPARARPAAAGPRIRTREDWGADEELRSGTPRPREVDMAVLHHTATTNSYGCGAQARAQVRNVYEFHTRSRGWDDIGYNFLVDRCGNIYEGRYGGMEAGIQGAHAQGWNRGSVGIAMLGTFGDGAPGWSAMQGLEELLAWQYSVHGLDPDPGARVRRGDDRVRTLLGHRNVGQTTCPGWALYARMDGLRADVADRFVTTADGTPVEGDWDGDGRATPGWFVDGVWYLRNATGLGPADELFYYGSAGDLPVVGDWDGDGRDTIGIVRDGTWHLRDSLAGGRSDRSFVYGRVSRGDVPLVGDWDGDGADTVGIVRDGEWHLRDDLAGGRSDRSFVYGRVTQGDVPLVGDWDGDGADRIGIVREGTWHLRDELEGGPSDEEFVYGRVTRGDVPLMADWSDDGIDTPGIVRGRRWHLRFENAGGRADASFAVPALRE